MTPALASVKARETVVAGLDPLGDPGWDQSVSALPGASFFHRSAWARVLHQAYGFTPHYFGTFAHGRLQSLLPLMEVDSWATGRRAVSLPFTDACSALASGPDRFGPLWSAALRTARDRRWTYVELRGGAQLLDGAPTSFSFWGHRLPLTPDPDDLFARASGAARRGVRLAQANGLTIEVSHTAAAMVTFYRLLGPTRQRHGVPPQPFRFFEALHQEVISRRQGCVILAYFGHTPVAGAVFLHAGRKAIYKYGASLSAWQHLRPNNLLIWEAIAWHARHGFDEMCFGRTARGNEGLRRFKLGWGTEESQLDYFSYHPRSARFVSPAASTQPWQRRIFQTLPLPFSRLLGAALYKHAG
jgi:hypothetical protein